MMRGEGQSRVEPFRYTDVVRATGGTPAGPVRGDPWIPAVTTDSREVPQGALFVPLRAKRMDSHSFIGNGPANHVGDAGAVRITAC